MIRTTVGGGRAFASAPRVSARPIPPVLAGALALAWLACAAPALAGTTGKLAGKVTNRAREPLAGVNVAIPALRLGAVTDAAGEYVILNVAPGLHDVRMQLIGHQPVTHTGVRIAADNTTRLDGTLTETAVEMAEIVVSAQRPVVETSLTSSRAIVQRDQIEALPVQELQDLVNLQAGVVDGHFRGGRLGEVQYQVSGVTVNNPFNNASTLRLDRSLLQEVQVLSGTFDAEYGQAMSGVVNAVLRSGGPKHEWNAELLGGDFLYPGSDARGEEWEARPGSVQNYQLSASGPTGLAGITFLLSGRHWRFDDHVWGERRFVPADRSDFENKVFVPTGDGEAVPLGFSREWNGLGKLSWKAGDDLDVGYEAILGAVHGRRFDYAWRFNPDGLPEQRTFSAVHGGDLTHRLSETSFWNLTVRHNYVNYRDQLYEDVFDPRYDAAGAPDGDPAYENDAVIQGASFTRFHQKTSALVTKGAWTSQIARDHLVKVGAEFQRSHVFFGTDGHLRYVQSDSGNVLQRFIDQPPDFPGVRQYVPHAYAMWAQDQIEWSDLTLRAGLRADVFDARATVPSDLQNPANAIAGAPPSTPVATTAKVSVSPRLGVSYPVGHRAGLFFAYGHFSQMPALGTVFDNADYSVLNELQVGESGRYGVLGNPDIKPERTVQYEFGFKQALTDELGADLTVFYKDIRDLLGVEFVSTYTTAEYARFTNIDFGSVLGFTLALDQRRIGRFSGAMDYTWQTAHGNSSDPRETATREAAGEDPRPRQIPLGWDQRHTLNVTLTLSEPNRWTASAVLRAASGQPYTPTAETGFGGGLEANSGRKPAGFTVDLRGERRWSGMGLSGALFGRVFNMLDTRFFNGFVFSDTGSPDYTRYPAAALAQLADPGRFYAPRRIEIGVSVSGGSK